MSKAEFLINEEYSDLVPEPVPAASLLPAWYRKLNELEEREVLPFKTVEKCRPFLDAMSIGWILKIPCDIMWEYHDNKEIGNEGLLLKPKDEMPFPVVDHHEKGALGPHYTKNRPIIKFLNPWVIKTPDHFSTIFTHPMNHPAKKFKMFSGIVETDQYPLPINGAAEWLGEKGESGVIEEGTPYYQIIPINRSTYKEKAVIRTITEEGKKEQEKGKHRIWMNKGSYQQKYWVPKGTQIVKKE